MDPGKLVAHRVKIMFPMLIGMYFQTLSSQKAHTPLWTQILSRGHQISTPMALEWYMYSGKIHKFY